MELTILSSETDTNTFVVAEGRGPKNTARLYNLRPGIEIAHFFYTETLFSTVKLWNTLRKYLFPYYFSKDTGSLANQIKTLYFEKQFINKIAQKLSHMYTYTHTFNTHKKFSNHKIIPKEQLCDVIIPPTKNKDSTVSENNSCSFIRGRKSPRPILYCLNLLMQYCDHEIYLFFRTEVVSWKWKED